MEGRIIEVNLATPKVPGVLKKTSPGSDAGSPPPVDSPVSPPGSSKALVEAELKLAQAQVEVLRLRKKLQMFN